MSIQIGLALDPLLSWFQTLITEFGPRVDEAKGYMVSMGSIGVETEP